MKIPKPIKQKNGKYRIQIRIDGKSVSITKWTEEECISEAMALKMRKSSHPEAPAYTLKELICLYIQAKEPVLSPSTIKGYDDILRQRFQSYMSKRVTSEFDLQQLVNDEVGKCSAKTLKNAYGLVSASIRYAGINLTPATLPRIPRNEQEFLTPEQIEILINAVFGHKYELAVLLALHSLRRSEVLGLTKENIKNGIIHVRGALVDSVNGFVYKETNKTDMSQRDIPVIIPRLNDLIRYAPSGILVDYPPERIYKYIRRTCKQNHLPEIGWHGLRHSFASLCYELQIDEKTCQRLGGWSDIETMRKIYIHIAEQRIDAETQKLINFFQKSASKKSEITENKNTHFLQVQQNQASSHHKISNYLSHPTKNEHNKSARRDSNPRPQPLKSQ